MNFSDQAINLSKIGNAPPLLKDDVAFALRFGILFGERTWFKRIIERTNRRLDGRPE